MEKEGAEATPELSKKLQGRLGRDHSRRCVTADSDAACGRLGHQKKPIAFGL